MVGRLVELTSSIALNSFSVPTGGAAYFNNAANIQNIFSRVTGTSVSNIDGLLRANSTANLFLLNPNGIIFGPNASLNIGGSFLASTASQLNFADGTNFSATPHSTTPLLTVSVPIGLQYGGNAGSIRNQSQAINSDGYLVGLAVQQGFTLALLGGDVRLEGGRLQALGGHVELGGLASPGSIGLNMNANQWSLIFPDGVGRADVYLTNLGSNTARVNVAASNAGSIAITARNIDISSSGSTVLRGGIERNLGFLGATAGDIKLNATEAINVANSFITNLVSTGAVGNGGNIDITAGSLSVTNGAQLDASTYGQGDAGSVNINTRNTVLFDGVDSNGYSSAAYSSVESGAVGNGGGINIQTGSLSVTNGARLNASTSGQGDAGSVNIHAGSTVFFDRVGSNGLPSSALSNVEVGALGNAGNINITAGALLVTNGAQLESRTRGRGNAGSVNIHAGSTVSFDGVSSNGWSSGAYSSVEENAIGNAGGINIQTGSLSVTNGARLNASTSGQGDAGSVNIHAGSTVFFDRVGSNGLPSSALSNVEVGALGNAGNINITAGALLVTNGAQLESRTRGRGNAGSVNIHAGSTVSFDGVSSNGWSSGAYTSVESGAVGNGGGINILTGSLSVTNGAQLQSLTRGQGNAGGVTITASGPVAFDGVDSNGYSSAAYSSVESGAVGNGGGINIQTGSLSVTNGARLNASTSGQGDAGSVNIHAGSTVFFDRVGSNGLPSSALSNVEVGALGNAGNINITAGALLVTNGAQLESRTRGRGNAGSVNIHAGSTVFFDGVGSNGWSSGAYSSVEENAIGNAGGINIQTGSLSVSNGARLQSLTRGQGDAGSVNIHAGSTVSFDGVGSNGLPSSALSNVEENAIGNAGDININTTAGALLVTNGAQLESRTRGRGNAGSVTITASGPVSFDGVSSNRDSSAVYSSVESGAVGNGGGIDITAGSLSVTNGARLNASTFGQGNAGSVTITADNTITFDGGYAYSTVEENAIGNAGGINIQTGSLSVTNGAQLQSLTRGQGNAGGVTITASGPVSFDGVSSNGDSSAVSSSVESGAVGNGGSINIKAESLSLTDGANIQTLVRGASDDRKLRAGYGNAGDVYIDVRDAVTIAGVNRKYGYFGGVVSSVNPETGGDAGNIKITAGSLSLTDGGTLSADTIGQGGGGNINLDVKGAILLTGGSTAPDTGESTRITLGVLPRGIGSGGNLNIKAGSLVLTDGAIIKNSTQGQGNAGNIYVNADVVDISGSVPSNGLPSGLFTSTISNGRAGNIIFDTRTFRVADGAALSALTKGEGQGGDISVNATSSFEAVNGGQIVTTTFGQGQAGNIFVNATERVIVSGSDPNYVNRIAKFPIRISPNVANAIRETGAASGLFASVGPGGVSNGGNINITTRSLSVTDGAGLSASSAGSSGAAGNIEVSASSIRLNNQAFLSSNTVAGQGNIILRSQDLVLRRGSNITTDATGSATGGNISIDTDILVALENSDIRATAEDAFGGRVTINSQGIFGTAFRNQLTPLSDITATSNLGPKFSGIVEINTPNIDPSHGLIDLPAEVVDFTGLIAQGCPGGGIVGRGESKFIVTGRGGLPPNPREPLRSDAVRVSLDKPIPGKENRATAEAATNPTSAEPAPLVEAQGWVINNKGEVVLIAHAPNVTPNVPWMTPAICHSSTSGIE